MTADEIRSEVRLLLGDEVMAYDRDDETDEWAEDRVSIFCNDAFWWGCADAEEVTPETLPILKQAVADAGKLGDLLYCSRVRNLRPQGAMYKHIPKDLHHLFDAAGPKRVIDIGNPYTQDGEYTYRRSTSGNPTTEK